MRFVSCCLMAALLCGCKMKDDDSPAQAENKNEGQKRAPGGVPGLVLPGDEGPKGGGQSTPPPAGNGGGNSIPKIEARFVEWPKAKQKLPGLEVVENKVQGSDPISVAASAYVSMSSKVESMNFQHQLRLLKEINEGNPPTFKQFQDLARQMRIQFQNQPAYRYYGYDTKTGGIVVLEDKIEKKRIYEEKGIPYED